MLPKDLLGQTYRLTFKVPETAGVYFIYCEANGKAYIGSSVRIYSRLYGHSTAANSLRFKGKKHTPEQIARAAAGKRASFEANSTIYRGEKNGRAKLTEDQVREIRRLYAEGKHSQADLGQLFDLNQRTISQIVRRKLWKFVT